MSSLPASVSKDYLILTLTLHYTNASLYISDLNYLVFVTLCHTADSHCRPLSARTVSSSNSNSTTQSASTSRAGHLIMLRGQVTKVGVMASRRSTTRLLNPKQIHTDAETNTDGPGKRRVIARAWETAAKAAWDEWHQIRHQLRPMALLTSFSGRRGQRHNSSRLSRGIWPCRHVTMWPCRHVAMPPCGLGGSLTLTNIFKMTLCYNKQQI